MPARQARPERTDPVAVGGARPRLESALHTTHAELDDLAPEWSALHRRAESGLPFEHPDWAATWARQFVEDGDLACVSVRERLTGALVGLAPLYRRHHGGRRSAATSIQPLGTGPRQGLTEVTQVLCGPGLTSRVLPAVIHELENETDWHWLQLTLGPDQGWLVPQWLGQPTSSILHRGVRPSVIFRPLPADRQAVLSGLKRNVRESVRRGTNRTRGLEGFALRTVTRPDEISEALASVIKMHRQRAALVGTVTHQDAVADDDQQLFLRRAVWGLARQGLARVLVAAIDGQDVAGLMVLSDGRTDYLSLSGLDPTYWDLNLNTLLIFEALVGAADLGRVALNLSTGPDIAKMRWSPEVQTHHDFAVVRSDRRSQALYGAFAHVSLARRHRQERVRRSSAA